MGDKKYKVYIDDNFHYMDEDERVFRKGFNTYEKAVAECKRIADRSLLWVKYSTYPKPRTPEELYKAYTSFGDDPFIKPLDDNKRFSAWSYAESRVTEIMNAREPIKWPTFSWPTLKRSPKPKRSWYFSWLDFVATATLLSLVVFSAMRSLWGMIGAITVFCICVGLEIRRARRRRNV